MFDSPLRIISQESHNHNSSISIQFSNTHKLYKKSVTIIR